MTPTVRRGLVLIVLIIALATFFGLGLNRFLTLETMKAQHMMLAAMFETDPLRLAGAFLLIHILALAICIPGAVLVPCLAAGAIFGLGWGTAISLSALTIGDSLSFLTARYLFRDWVEGQFGRQAAAVREGVNRDGAFYLLSLRLMAIIPFFVVNLTMGLTRMKLTAFAPMSFIGLLPATLLYVHAGTRIASIERPSDIYSMEMLAAFALLALFPLAARLLIGRRRPLSGRVS
ncbi:MAG: TVP38/TMEM64 family protein [Sphingomonas sp.]|nr:TVP38/TMEM64 family protein [Sphingomonas sp.]